MSKPIWENITLPGSAYQNKYRSLLTKNFRLYCIKTGLRRYTTWLTHTPNKNPDDERTVWQPVAFTADSDTDACSKSTELLFEYLFERQEIIELLLQKTSELGGIKLCKSTSK